MSSFNGQMKEYTRVAIDQFYGKNIQCTAFFLSHCHKDHMDGLNSSSFANSLHTRNGIFLYCSEITHLLLLENYHHLQKYIRVLKVGVPQPVCVPSNSTSVADYYVNVTLISAGHCPGSVMFLFEGHEGRCLYTGDFRWEIGKVAGIAAFKEENRLKKIKSIYVDTTFCTPEAFHIPNRSECIDAAVTLIADWLQRSTLNVVFMSCPARYGYEHLMMEISAKLNIKIHVLEDKTLIYDQIPDLRNVFTSDPTQTRIHACSAKYSFTSSLPCHSSEGKHVNILNLRPSAMWFTLDKSTEKRDLVVPPASPKGVYRICYSTHSSYSEIRDLVSYLQPENVFPNVQPKADASIEAVQARLHTFQKHINSGKVQMSVGMKSFQPLGTLRKIDAVHTSMQKQQSKENPDELVFSSQEADSKNELLRSTTGCSPHVSSPSSGAGKLEGGNNLIQAAFEGSSSEGVLNSSTSNAHSSYKGSVVSDEKLLFSDSGDKCKQTSLKDVSKDGCENHDGGIDLSGHSDTSENIPNCEREVITVGDCGKDTIIVHSATHEVDVCAVGSSQCGDNQSTQAVSLIRQQKPRKASTIGTDLACELSFRSQNIHENTAHDLAVTNILMSNGASTSFRPLSYTEVYRVTKNDLELNVCTIVNGFKDDDIVFSSQMPSTTKLIKNQVHTMVAGHMSAISDQREEDHEAAAITDNDTSSRTVDSQILEVVSVLSSDDSLNSLEHESQTLWSVSYSLDNFVQDCGHSGQVTDTKISLDNSVPSIHTGNENSSLKQREGTTSAHTIVYKDSSCNQENAQVPLNRNASQLQTYPALKRKYISNNTAKRRGFQGITRVMNDNKYDSVAEINNKCNFSGQRAEGLNCPVSRLNKSSGECQVSGSERNISRVETAHSVTLKSRQAHIQDPDGCHHHSAAQSNHIWEKSDWIDLTIETPTELIDLTVEDSP